MKPAIQLLCAMMLCGLLCASLHAQAAVYSLPQHDPTAPLGPVPISEEPHHRLLLQNDFTRVYNVMVPPLDTTLLHQHDLPYLYITFGPADIINAINLALTGNSTDAGGTDPILPALTSDMITMNIERVDPTSGVPTACDCSISGCDTNAGGGSPDFVVVSIPNGYTVTPVIPGVTLPSGPILLRPSVRVPFGGT